MRRRFKSIPGMLACLILLGLPNFGAAQGLFSRGPMPVSEAKGTGQYIATGMLDFREGQYVLLDDRGQLEAYLVPQNAIDLSRFTGKNVHATVRQPFLRISGERKLLVDQVTVVETSGAPGLLRHSLSAVTQGPIALAQYAEPVTIEGVPTNVRTLSDRAVPTNGGPPGWIWGSVEYLWWRPHGMGTPPLVTTSPVGTPRENAGVLDEPGTQILFGNSNILNSETSAGRLRLGAWFDRDHRFGIQADYLSVDTGADNFLASSDTGGIPILARPFFNINPRDPFTDVFDPPAREDSQLVSYPDILQGTVAVDANSDFETSGLMLRALLAGTSFCSERGAGYSRVDGIVGYRYVRLEDSLTITENVASLQPQFPVAFQINDQFSTRNKFNGADLGVIWQAGWRKWSADFLLKTAIGNVHQEVTIRGGTTVTESDLPSVDYSGGLLALPSNIGSYSKDRFGIVPELGVNLKYAIRPKLFVTFGYTFIYWGSVVRPGDQIDRDINPDQLAPPIIPMEGAYRPAFTFQEVDYWAQGLSAGIEGRW